MLALTLGLMLSAAPAWTKVKRGLDFLDFGGDYPFADTRIEVEGGPLRLLVSKGDCGVSRDAVRAWVELAAQQVAAYLGRFPHREGSVTVLCGGSGTIGGGVTYAGRAVRIELGKDTTAADLGDEWRMPHELLHLAFPDVDERYHYLEEGLSTYLEPIVRAQSGQISQGRVWAEMVNGFPNGTPARSDRGLDNTPTWGNTYWGGARFWLVVDLELRLKTGGKKTLQDLMRALVKDADGRHHWDPEQLFTLGRVATGTNVVKDVHARMGAKRAEANLDALWKSLGVSLVEGRVKFDDVAPFAAQRKAITLPRLSADEAQALFARAEALKAKSPDDAQVLLDLIPEFRPVAVGAPASTGAAPAK